jgi:type II secretory pathway component GspD/PulD (secretin)
VGAKTNKVTTPVPLPKFRKRSVATSAAVLDGQTLVIGAGTARHLEQKRNADGTTTNSVTEKELFYFITPTIIDAAGNALHAK